MQPWYCLLKRVDTEGTLFIRRRSGFLFAAVAASMCLAGPAPAQTRPTRPNSGDVAQQFKTGANRVGEGAAQIGEGIKQGAIMTWETIKHGAASIGTRVDPRRNAPSTTPAPSSRQSP